MGIRSVNEKLYTKQGIGTESKTYYGFSKRGGPKTVC